MRQHYLSAQRHSPPSPSPKSSDSLDKKFQLITHVIFLAVRGTMHCATYFLTLLYFLYLYISYTYTHILWNVALCGNIAYYFPYSSYTAQFSLPSRSDILLFTKLPHRFHGIILISPPQKIIVAMSYLF